MCIRDSVSAVMAIQQVDILKAHVEERGALYEADQNDREKIYAYRKAQLERERVHTELLETELIEHKQRRMAMQGEIRENGAAMCRARDEEAALLDNDRRARRELEINKRECELADKEHKDTIKMSLEQDGLLADELSDLQTKHTTIRRKLEDGTKELLESLVEIEKEIKAAKAKNIEDERAIRVQERVARDETRAATRDTKRTEDEIHTVKRELVDMSRKHTEMVVASQMAHKSFRDAGTKLDQALSPRSRT
eukprot:TRINITY_DN2487_c0_g1_i2.p1 TRINITY_DN2487_c0_g1~~TRINITY_DN2487_c0_g1_i2.p1  ORF type:complete len:253 (+),score=93.49 TRINITY_DN2487_c0_g1_i2:53-811(+)